MSQPRPTTSSMDTLSIEPSQVSSIESCPFESSYGTYSWPYENPVSNSWNDNLTLLEAFGAPDFTQVLPLPDFCTSFPNPDTGLYPMNSFQLNQLYGGHLLLCNPPSTPFMAGIDTTNPSIFSRWYGDTYPLDWNVGMDLGNTGIVSSEHKDETQSSQQCNTSYVATETLPAPSLDIVDPQRMFPDFNKAKRNTPTQESCLQLPDDPFDALFVRQAALARGSTADSEGPSSTIPDSCQDGTSLYPESNTSREEIIYPSHFEVPVPQFGYPQAPGTPEFRSQCNYESSTPRSCLSPTGQKSKNKPREGKIQRTPLKQLMPSLRPENRFEERSIGPSRCVAEPRPRLHMKRKHTRDVEENETQTVPKTQHKRKRARKLKLLRLEAKHVSISNAIYKWSSRGWVPEYGLESVPTRFIDTEIVDEIQFTLNSGNFQTVWFSRARGNNSENPQWEGLDGSGIYKISLSEHDIEFVLKDAKRTILKEYKYYSSSD